MEVITLELFISLSKVEFHPATYPINIVALSSFHARTRCPAVLFTYSLCAADERDYYWFVYLQRALRQTEHLLSHQLHLSEVIIYSMIQV